jgi:hydroxyacylglutathione hydrolase
LRITHVTETHITPTSCPLELGSPHGARLLLSAEGDADWQYRIDPRERAELLRDGDTFTLGEIRVEARHMPGHTPEHLVFFVTDNSVADRPVGVFTGDFIFAGDVGRPDLLERAARVTGTMEHSARALSSRSGGCASSRSTRCFWLGHSRLGVRQVVIPDAVDDAWL